MSVTTCEPPLKFYTVPPCRVFDSRQSAPLIPGKGIGLSLSGSCGIPVTAKVVSANVTAVQPQSSGFITVFPNGSALPPTSTVNFQAGQIRANNATLALGNYGYVVIYAGTSAPTDVLLDVNGYYQ